MPGALFVVVTRMIKYWEFLYWKVCINTSGCHYYSYLDILRNYPERTREILYYLSVAHYRLSNYSKAKIYIERFLEKEPSNLQANALLKRIETKVTNGITIFQVCS